MEVITLNSSVCKSDNASDLFYASSGVVACTFIVIGLLSYYQIVAGLNKISRWTFVALGSATASLLIMGPTKNPYIPKKERSKIWLIKEAFFSCVTALFYFILTGITKPFSCSEKLYHRAFFNGRASASHWVNARYFKGRVLLQTNNLLNPSNVDVIDLIPEKANRIDKTPVVTAVSWNNQSSPPSNWHSNGLCQGNSQVFIATFHANLKELGSVHEAAIATTQFFVNGAPEKAALMQYLYELTKADVNYFNSSKMKEEHPFWVRKAFFLTTRILWGHFKLGAKDVIIEGVVALPEEFFPSHHLRNLKDGTFDLSLLDEKNKNGHSVVLIKNGEGGYLFDANIGLIPIEDTLEECLNRLLQAYRSQPFIEFSPSLVIFSKIVY